MLDNVTLRSRHHWFLRSEVQETPLSSWSLRRTILSLELLHSLFTWKTLKNFNPISYFLLVCKLYCTVWFWEIGTRSVLYCPLCPQNSLCPPPLLYHLVKAGSGEIYLDFLHHHLYFELTKQQRLTSLSFFRLRPPLFPRWRRLVTPQTLTTMRRKSWEFLPLKSVLKNLVTFKTLKSEDEDPIQNTTRWHIQDYIW